ncbi:MAG: hypothetical protein ACRDSL_22325 [Pseudonocardiaceae bacterium]
MRGNETVRGHPQPGVLTKLYVDGGRVTDQELNEPFNMLHEPYVVYRERQAERRSRQGAQPHTYYRQGAAVAFRANWRPLRSKLTKLLGSASSREQAAPTS